LPCERALRGRHINFHRDQGFAELQPLREGAWAENAAAQLLALRPTPRRASATAAAAARRAELARVPATQVAPVEPLIEFAQRARELRERARQESARPPPDRG